VGAGAPRGPMRGDGAEGSRTREVHLEVLRTARVALLEAKGPTEGGAITEAWYLLHGYRQLARRLLRRFGPLAAPHRLVAAPEGLSRFYLDAPDRAHGERDPVGASWMTREDRSAEIRDYLRYLDRTSVALEGGRAVRRTVLGFSQGAHTAARWAVMGRSRADRLVLWGAGFPSDLPDGASAALGGVEIVLVRGDSDGLRRREEEEREEAWLAAEGLSWRVMTHPGGHEISPEVLSGLMEWSPG
jgi:predicted esterase